MFSGRGFCPALGKVEAGIPVLVFNGRPYRNLSHTVWGRKPSARAVFGSPRLKEARTGSRLCKLSKVLLPARNQTHRMPCRVDAELCARFVVVPSVLSVYSFAIVAVCVCVNQSSSPYVELSFSLLFPLPNGKKLINSEFTARAVLGAENEQDP